MDFAWPNFGTWAISHFKQLVFNKGKPCQAQKRRYLLSLLKLPGSAVLVISYKWIYNQSYRTPISQLMDTYGVNFTMVIYGYAAVMHIKVSSTDSTAPHKHCFPPKNHGIRRRRSGPQGPISPWAQQYILEQGGDSWQIPELFALRMDKTSFQSYGTHGPFVDHLPMN